MREDLRWAFRYASRRPILTLIITVTLACAIATAATAFGLAQAVLWRDLPFRDSSRLFFVWEETQRDGQLYPSRVTGARHAAWRDAAEGAAAIALFGSAEFTTAGAVGAISIHAVRASANYFDTLGIRPLLGRTFTPEDEEPGKHYVAILSHAIWQEQFGGRRDIVGDTIRLGGRPYRIVGVMPHAAYPAWPVNPAVVTIDPDSRQLWVPIQRSPELDHNARAHVFGVLARLAPGVAQPDLTARLNRSIDVSAADPHGARLQPLRAQFVDDARPQLLALAGTALAVLLIACTNLAALCLSAFESRRGELAVRIAVGASVMRLIRQLVLEIAVLAGAAAAGGMAIARVALAAIPGFLPPTVPFLTTPRVDWAVASFAIMLAGVASAIVTGWPILRVVAAAPSPRGTALAPRAAVYRGLVIGQVAMTVALVSVAGLLATSLQTIRQRSAGFAIDHVLVASVRLPAGAGANPASIAVAERDVLSAISARPGVRAVAAAYDHPLEANWSESLTILGDSVAEERRQQVELRIVSPEYFDALGVELLDGRVFTSRETIERPGVVVVNEALARAVGGRVLGRRIRSGPPRLTYGNAAAAEFEIVGVVENERFRGLERPSQPAYYLSTQQFPQTSFSLLIRTAGDPLAAAADVRSAVRGANSGAAFDHATSLDRILADQLAQRRVTTQVIGGFATAALSLAALAMYALLTILVGSRTREIGVRLAIGAAPLSMAREVVGDGLRSTIAGIASGCVLALLAGSAIQALLVDVSPRDPLTLGTVAALLLTVAVAASAVPALRAARIDPIEALRAE